MSVSDKFRSENPKDWDNDTLSELLLELSREHIPNDMVRHRAIIQALTILNEQNRRQFKKLEKRNLILTIAVIVLTIIQVLIGFIQILN
jgi:hypothetical protein